MSGDAGLLGLSIIQSAVASSTIILFFVIKSSSRNQNGLRWGMLPLGFAAAQAHAQHGLNDEAIAQFIAGGLPIAIILFIVGYTVYKDKESTPVSASKKIEESGSSHVIGEPRSSGLEFDNQKLQLTEWRNSEREKRHAEINERNLKLHKEENEKKGRESKEASSVKQVIDQDDTSSYLKADKEFNTNREEGLWIKMLALNDGDERRAKANYIRNRANFINSINDRDEHGKTVLFSAVDEGDIAMVMKLLELGADPNVEAGLFSTTPVSLAKKKLSKSQNDDQRALYSEILDLLEHH